MKLRFLLLAALTAALTVLVWLRHPPAGPQMERRVPAALAPDAVPPATNIPSPSAAAPTEEPSHLADSLNAPGGDIHADLRIVNRIFEQYRSATHGADPVGENREITAALTGRNPLGFAFVPGNHPAINAAEELCDRWGTPFFFHQLSGTRMEIRSAGPDRKLWTGDDEVLTP